jgi:hypothetical protein
MVTNVIYDHFYGISRMNMLNVICVAGLQAAGSQPTLLGFAAAAAAGMFGSGFELDGPGSVLEALGVLAAIIAVHEWGHFTAARLQGIHVTQFAIGFGPSLVSFKASLCGAFSRHAETAAAAAAAGLCCAAAIDHCHVPWQGCRLLSVTSNIRQQSMTCMALVTKLYSRSQYQVPA